MIFDYLGPLRIILFKYSKRESLRTAKPYQKKVRLKSVGARRTYGFRDLIAILAPDFGFNCEN